MCYPWLEREVLREVGEGHPNIEIAQRLHLAEGTAAAERHGASKVRIYGSIARVDASPISDIDVLVEMEEGRSLLDLAALHLELEEILGYPAEIGTDVEPRLRESVRAETVAL